MKTVNEICLELTLEQTCSCCPEQYDVFDGNNQTVGFIHLRHGLFSVYYPGYEGIPIFSAIIGDGYQGSFASDFERTMFLNAAKLRIANKIFEEQGG